jgi:phosphotransacetylase
MQQAIDEFRQVLIESGFAKVERTEIADAENMTLSVDRIQAALSAAGNAKDELNRIARLVHDSVVEKALEADRSVADPSLFERLRSPMEAILAAAAPFKREPGFVKAYGELLSIYILILYRSGTVGRESPIIRMIIANRARRKAPELSPARLDQAIRNVGDSVTIALMAKRRAVHLLAAQGTKVLLRAEIEFRTAGSAPESLALQATNLLVKHGIKLSDVSDIVCGGGDLGTLPDGIYVLNEQVRDESLRRLQNSSLNRGALVAWELKEMLESQGGAHPIRVSLTGPLSFCTLNAQEMGSFLRVDTQELANSIKGLVKVTPLKSAAAVISEIERISPWDLNLVAMTLDELFASVARKTGACIVREMAAQDANSVLNRFDFDRILDSLREERFEIPGHFRLAQREMGTGVKEICELLMIIESGKLSPGLSSGLMHVVDAYARRAAMIIEMASAGAPSERPHYVVITSMMALDPYFLTLFGKIRNRVENPFTPVMCLDSLEHEYLIASHLFETRITPSQQNTRLILSEEKRNIHHALQVLRVAGGPGQAFSFSRLLEDITAAISDGRLQPGNLVLVGADNEDALTAVSNARDYGLLKRLVLIGDPEDVKDALERTKIPISLSDDPNVTLLKTDPLSVDFEAKKESMAKVFREFIETHQDFVIMKGSISTAPLLRQALSIYHSDGDGEKQSDSGRRVASHTALFVLPDGRFFALSDAGVNPGFANPAALLKVIENQVEIVRKVVDPKTTLKLAIVTAVEKQTSAIPATYLAAETVELAKGLEGKYGPLIAEGPLSFDLATVPDVADEKHYEGRIKGDANCLAATDINTANVMYKMLSKTMGSLGLIIDTGSVITAGAGSAPIVLTSRGDTAQTKFNSILLAFAYSCRGRGECGCGGTWDAPGGLTRSG